jgi:hypothetical protein
MYILLNGEIEEYLLTEIKKSDGSPIYLGNLNTITNQKETKNHSL